jgi:hypothetical protein
MYTNALHYSCSTPLAPAPPPNPAALADACWIHPVFVHPWSNVSSRAFSRSYRVFSLSLLNYLLGRWPAPLAALLPSPTNSPPSLPFPLLPLHSRSLTDPAGAAVSEVRWHHAHTLAHILTPTRAHKHTQVHSHTQCCEVMLLARFPPGCMLVDLFFVFALVLIVILFSCGVCMLVVLFCSALGKCRVDWLAISLHLRLLPMCIRCVSKLYAM